MTITSKADHIMALAVQAKIKGIGVFFFAARYAYVGNPIEVGDGYVVLDNAAIPFSTGEFANAKYSELEKMPHGQWTVFLDAVESCGLMK